jgi:hypothetical protein
LELSAMTLCAKYVNSVVNVLSILIVQSRKWSGNIIRSIAKR